MDAASHVHSAEHGIDRQEGGKLRPLLILGVLAVTALPSQCEKRLSITQLERLLVEDNSRHKPDFDIAKQIAGVALTERIFGHQLRTSEGYLCFESAGFSGAETPRRPIRISGLTCERVGGQSWSGTRCGGAHARLRPGLCFADADPAAEFSGKANYQFIRRHAARS